MSSSLSRVLTGLGVLAALAVVAVASRGSLPETRPGTREPSETLLDLAFSLYVVSLGVGLVLVVVLMVLRRVAVLENDAARRNPLTSVVLIALLGVGLYFALRHFRPEAPPAIELPEFPPAATIPEGESAPPRQSEQYEAEFAWKPMLALALLLALFALGWWRASVARRQARVREPRQSLAEALADVLAETLDELRAEPDPRRAVIGAYARLERVAAASGLARRPAEAPLEYLGRMLAGLEVSASAVRSLTVLFERAKFSQHEVDEGMKQEAIRALESVQEDLRLAELRRREEQQARRELEHARLRERAKQ